MVLPLLLDIFLPCGSSAQPEIMTFFHGAFPSWSIDFIVVLKSQNDIMS